MKNKLLKLLPLAPILTVIVVSLIIVITNYKLGAYLSGWDTLHPEFNLELYFQRVLFGAWQEHQGLGAPAAQAHAAELTRLPLLLLLDLLLPTSAVRYVFFSLMYILGGIGIYVFIRYCWFEHKVGKSYDWGAAFGGILYLLNLGTLQQFYVPLEMFAVHFASIGFILYSLYHAAKYNQPKYYASFFILQLLASSAAHTATLFYMYMATLFVYAGILIFQHRRNAIETGKQLIILGAITIIANFFWMGPNLYYILRHSNYVTDAKITREFSSEAFWQNQAFGDVPDLLILKNFLFNWNDYDFESKSFVPLFNEWQSHLQGTGYAYLIFIAVLCVVGLILSFFNKDRRHSFAFLALFIIPAFFINNLNFPSRLFYFLLESVSGTFSEALRFPFTKFSILLMVALSVYFANFAGFVLRHFQKLSSEKDKKYFLAGGIVVLFLLIAIPTFPAFQGNLISSRMKIFYPSEYFQLFKWFDTQPHQSRIVKFPLVSHFGWTYHQWPMRLSNQGYQGAGFIWFGLPQPILDREFDRWSASNEYFYYELSQAVNHDDPAEFRQVLDKYNVSWLLYDESAFNTDSQFNKDYKAEFDDLVSKTNGVSLAQQFNFLKVYSVANDNNNSWVGSTSATEVSTSVTHVKDDVIYNSEGNYISKAYAALDYPFAQLRSETNSSYAFEQTGLSASTKTLTEGTLTLPKWTDENKSISVEVYAQLTGKNTLEISVESLLPKLQLNDTSLALSDYAPQKSVQYQMELPDPNATYILKLSNSYITFKPTTQPLYFGAFSLPLENIPIELYSSAPANTTRLISGYNYTAINCFDQQPNPDITTSVKGDALFLFAYQNTACATQPQFHTIPGKGLLSLEYTYRSTTPNTYTRVCLYRKGAEGCINQDEYYIDIASENEKSLQVFEPIDTAGDINVSFDLSAETDGKNIEYSKAYLSFYPHLKTLEITASSLASLAPQAFTMPVKSGTTIVLTQPYGRDNELLSQKNLNQLATTQNCSAEGEVTFTPGANKHVITSVNKGIACEHFLFDNIVPTQEYIATITSNNLKGKEMLVHLLESERTLVDEVFPRGTFTHNFWVDNRRHSDDLQLWIEAHSYGSFEAVNELMGLAVAPFPVSYASKMKVESSRGAVHYPPAQISDTARKANFWYTVETKTDEQSLIYLSQTFDPGWRAFAGGKELSHFTYNSWANAWIVPAGTQRITIFYFPQLMEFSGIVLVICAALLGWMQYEFKLRDFFSGKYVPRHTTIKSSIFDKFTGK